ncbi:MAG TPA: dihydrofolate reductase [Dokdonella sp.]|uniref:dihydrofolate reductase n=1 Tax=Dokdonella sp. TaxID=2291710 RepID=UPI002BB5E98C|nr:dihydrofolate reductase [Dokdonella sp.]HUD43375.1 dihydrofolate reductase [Dokdonella sp.]
MAIALIAALDRNRAIGRAGGLPWHLPDDLKRFKALTLGGTVLMGRTTAESIGRALPGRRNLVLTRRGHAPYPGQEAVDSLPAARALAGDADLLVIGGGEVYGLTLPQADRLHLTLVDTEVDGADAWFPAWPPAQWREVARVAHVADMLHAHSFSFVDYCRTE